MNPLSLLTKGRTIRGLKARPGPYKLPGKNALPVFSGSKAPGSNSNSSSPANPIPTTSHAEASEAPNVEQPLFEQKQPAAQAVKAEGLGHFTDRLTGWVRERWSGHGNQPPANETIQTELALDKVKVIRNDLSEDDLEIVAIDKKSDKKAGKKKEKAPGKDAEQAHTTAAP